MDSKKYIQTVIKDIEQYLSEKINVEELSSKHFISPRQLYRDFYSFTGHSVNEYIRKRRLSKALSLLKHSDMSITDAAYSCGYSSVQALCRSIRSTLNITPTEYRNNADTYYFPMYDDIRMKQITIESQSIPKLICIKYYHSRLIGIEDKAVNYIQSILPGYTGRLFGRNGIQVSSQFCYEIYIEYNDEYLKKIKQDSFIDITVCSDYTATFACTTIKYIDQEINTAWDFLYGYWLKNSMFEQDATPYFEEYIIKDCIIKKLILHLPIKSRESFYKINIKAFDERLFITASHNGINAEKLASNKVVDFIAEHYPFLLKTQKEFYISKVDKLCVCGINIDKRLPIPDNEAVNILTLPKGLYAILESSCFGSGNEYEQHLINWLHDNGFEVVGNPFSLYDTSNGTEQNKIIVKSQVLVKGGRI